MELKKRKKFRYTQCFKNYEIDLTWEFFINGLKENLEFCFYYKDLVIDIAFHYENEKKIYELNISNGNNFEFETIDELVNSKGFDGKSIYDIWEQLEN